MTKEIINLNIMVLTSFIENILILSFIVFWNKKMKLHY